MSEALKCSKCGHAGMDVLKRPGGAVCMNCLRRELAAAMTSFERDRVRARRGDLSMQPGVIHYRRASVPRPRRPLRRG